MTCVGRLRTHAITIMKILGMYDLIYVGLVRVHSCCCCDLLSRPPWRCRSNEKAKKKKYGPNPLSAISVCFGFV